MKYSECFYSVQGEGSLTGVPSVFFRTSHCNLRCWYCDTPFTSWKPENKEISVEESVDTILEYDNVNHVVITGGEPYLFGGELQQLVLALAAANKHITIETNGTIYEDTFADLVSLSPKLSNSTPWEADKKWAKKHERDRINKDTLAEFMLFSIDYQFKFVVDPESLDNDLLEIRELQDDLGIPNHKIFLMPEGIKREHIIKKQEEIVKVCLEYGYRFSDRLHVRLYDDRRGV